MEEPYPLVVEEEHPLVVEEVVEEVEDRPGYTLPMEAPSLLGFHALAEEVAGLLLRVEEVVGLLLRVEEVVGLPLRMEEVAEEARWPSVTAWMADQASSFHSLPWAAEEALNPYRY